MPADWLPAVPGVLSGCDTNPVADGSTPIPPVARLAEVRLAGVMLFSADMCREVYGMLLRAAGGLTLLLQQSRHVALRQFVFSM